ncbi:MAG: right-handed parallel beta-helix repeat-containing protein [Thermoplasmata archaeon]|nr:right-handed parallel beta-helix repeat-containing protein [Thermoplasmata archaeon]
MKWICLSISFLLLLFSFSGSLQIKTSCYCENGNILYVGGNGEGNYSSIQDAINAAENGYTIYVYPGYYNESIVINKSISLIGIIEDGEKPVIIGSGTETIWIAVNDTSVKNFVIRNLIDSDITNRGILAARIYKPHNIHIENNTIFASPSIVMSANYSTIANNTIDGMGDDGILSSGFKNKVIFNNVCNCSEEFSIAIYVGGRYNIVYENTIHNNSIGISCYGRHNNISYNLIYKNRIGIEIWEVFSPSSYNEIHDNFIYKCGEGIKLSASYNRIYKNNISSCDTAIRMYGACYNVIENNTIYNNSWAGIEMDGTGEEINFPVRNNTIRYNKIIKNSRFLAIGGYCSNNYIIKNDFIDYGKLAGVVAEIYIPSKRVSIPNKWEGNYWDDWNKLLPKPIKGYICVHFSRFTNVYPFIVFDWHPSLQPNCS